MNRCWIAPFVITVCSSCSNAVMFYETDKISLTLEEKVDSAEPVSLSFGLKERVVLIAPTGDAGAGLSPAEGTKPRHLGAPTTVDDGWRLRAGEAASVITSFDFRKYEDKGVDRLFNDTINIRSVFITGAAARNLTPKQAQNAASAISLGALTETDLAVLNLYYGDLENLGYSALARRLDALIAFAPRTYEVDQYGSGSVPDAPAPCLLRTVRGGAEVKNVTDFGALLSYYSQLRDTVVKLSACLPQKGSAVYSGAIQEENRTILPITEQIARDRNLWNVRDRSRALQEELAKRVNLEPAVAELVALVRTKLGG